MQGHSEVKFFIFFTQSGKLQLKKKEIYIKIIKCLKLQISNVSLSDNLFSSKIYNYKLKSLKTYHIIF